MSQKTYTIAWLPGDGIGREVTEETIRVLRAVAESSGFSLTFDEYPMGGTAIDATGNSLPDETRQASLDAHGVLLGAVGGPKWDDRTGDQRPESGLLQLRKSLGVYANLRPVTVLRHMAGGSPLRMERVAGTDILVVRELTGGIYFGEPRGRTTVAGAAAAVDSVRYSDGEIVRIARIAFEWARKREGHVTSVDKANVLEVSQLWREVVKRVHRQEYPEIELNHLYVDNAAMQLVLDPKQFDVILTGNIFGDILSDLAATLPGSLGLLPSASIGGSTGLFEPVHGSAPDIAGQNKANPIAAILSGAMMLDELGQPEAAAAVRQGVGKALEAGYRTGDLWQEGQELASTTTMGEQIATHAARAVGEVAGG
jgi:3-isopropylmalate dehydrogenase